MTEEEISEIPENPWDELLGTLSFFSNELDCVIEMHELVAPVIKEKDEERKNRINELTELVDDPEEEGKQFRQIKSRSGIKELLGHFNKMRRADRVYRANVITSIVSKFDEFFVSVLIEAYKKNPDWLKHTEKKLSYREVLEIESLDDLKEELIMKEANSLMRDSHNAQIVFLDKKLSLGITDNFRSWKSFLEITERRNLFTHNGGKVNDVYLSKCKEYGIPIHSKISENTTLTATDDYINEAVDLFYELSVRIVQATCRRLYPRSFEEADDRLNDIGYDLLVNERWSMAEKILSFALEIPDKMRSKSEMQYYHVLNMCIALKEQGKDFEKTLKSIDWAPFHPKFHFAINALRDNHDETAKYMRMDAVHEIVAEEGFRAWPILRNFRQTEIFKTAYKDIFSKDYDEELINETENELRAQQDGVDNA